MGLAVLQTLPETAERTSRSLADHLGPALMNTKGFAAPRWNTPMSGAALVESASETAPAVSVPGDSSFITDAG
jgi:hypothetical protein